MPTRARSPLVTRCSYMQGEEIASCKSCRKLRLVSGVYSAMHIAGPRWRCTGGGETRGGLFLVACQPLCPACNPWGGDRRRGGVGRYSPEWSH